MKDFTIHCIQGYVSRIHIVDYGDRLLLVESGSRSDIPRIKRFFDEKLKRPISDVTLCLVTHMHPDHAGGARLLRKKFGIQLAGHKDMDTWYGGITGSIQHIADTLMTHGMRIIQGRKFNRNWYSKKVRPDVILDDGDYLPEFPDWQIIHIPGHTLHDVALFHIKKKILYTADTIFKENGKWILPIPLFFKHRMRHSYLKMEKLSPKQIITAHGEEIKKEELKSVFQNMIQALDRPQPNLLLQTAHSMSAFTPQVWKRSIAKIARRFRERNKGKHNPGKDLNN